MNLDSAYEIISARDRSADGAFVFAVTSTSIYCRPSCPARRPRRENVRIFATNEEAEFAGFRACLRCRPNENRHAPLQRAKAMLDAREGERVTLTELSAAAGLSPHHLQRVFKREYGLSPAAYAAALRQSRLRGALRTERSVTDAVYEAGYASSSRVYETADATIGMTPAAYRRGGAGVTIRYALADSTAGRLLVALTSRGVCAILLADSDAELEQSLRDEYPRATIERAANDAAIGAVATDVISAIDGSSPAAASIVLDVAGSAFQRRVWSALREIPCGETRTYAQLARAIGHPAAVRAVAGACGSNRVAVVIPCHRIVRGDGTIGGYRWGEARKIALLARERAE